VSADASTEAVSESPHLRSAVSIGLSPAGRRRDLFATSTPRGCFFCVTLPVAQCPVRRCIPLMVPVTAAEQNLGAGPAADGSATPPLGQLFDRTFI